MNKLTEDLEWIFSTSTIRSQSKKIWDLSLSGGTHFHVSPEKIGEIADLVTTVTKQNYPDLKIPYHSRWNHFRAGGVDRPHSFFTQMAGWSKEQRARAELELVITSVLLDAGAGNAWVWVEKGTHAKYHRSEGLALASLELFLAGAMSSDPRNPFRVDADGLLALTGDEFNKVFQITKTNPMVGAHGRFEILKSLGGLLQSRPDFFGSSGRLGLLADMIFNQVDSGGKLFAEKILRVIQVSLGPIWPGRITWDHQNVGDVWKYDDLGAGRNGLVPFHKLSQWLTYSLIEVFERAGCDVVGLEDLTGLPEYRNGGLFFDGGVLQLRDSSLLERAHRPDSQLIVEWRALTIVLLDMLWPLVCERLGKTQNNFPLACMLEGGTWWAGRKLASQIRGNSGGGSPINIESDGTVF